VQPVPTQDPNLRRETRGTMATRLQRPEPEEVSAVSQASVSSAAWAPIAEVDPELWAAMEAERHRQTDKIELIASENYVFQAVNEAQGSWLTNKYAEGLPGRRYYGGCEHVDVAENLARARALALFPGSDHVNVQPHSGAQANMAAYFAVLRPGDRILGMSLAHGGHLTHGSPVNFSGQLYEVHAYGVDRETERIDYDVLEAQATQVRPKVVVAGASAYPRTWDFERMAAIAHGVGALLFVDMAHVAGLVAAGLHPSPFPHADLVTTTTHKTLRGPRGGLVFARADLPEGVDRADFPALGKKNTLAQAVDKSVFPGVQGGPLMQVVAAKAVALLLADTDEFRRDQARTIENARVLAETIAEAGARLVSGGTDNHLALVDVTPMGVTGREAEALLDDVGITVNKNAIPFDSNPPNVASGIRIGTPATTTRGMGPDEMRTIGHLVVEAIISRDDAAVHARIREDVRELVARFPVPGLPRDRD
jgi:glycine hydroxymethyltransferase